MSQKRLRTVLLFGAPGVGKGTQGRILGQVPGFFHMSSGEVFRALQQGSPEEQEASRYISRGQLVPDDLTIKIVCAALDEAIAAGRLRPESHVLLLDGVPRSVRQAEMLEETIDVRRIIHLACPDEETLIARLRGRALKEGRADDASEEVVRYRYEVYRNETTPLLRYYPGESISEVDPLGTPAEVLRRILDCVIPVQKAASRSGDAV